VHQELTSVPKTKSKSQRTKKIETDSSITKAKHQSRAVKRKVQRYVFHLCLDLGLNICCIGILRWGECRGGEKHLKTKKKTRKEGVCSGGAATYGGRPPRRHHRPPHLAAGEEENRGERTESLREEGSEEREREVKMKGFIQETLFIVVQNPTQHSTNRPGSAQLPLWAQLLCFYLVTLP